MRLFLALLALAFCTPALADEPDESLPQVVVTATRVPTPDTDIPAGVTVIDRQTIEERGYNTLVDALQAVPGLRVSPSGGPGGKASVFIRGTNSDHVLVLRDGMPINDASGPGGAFNFGVGYAGRYRAHRDHSRSDGGVVRLGAIGGVINLISRRGTEPGVHWEGDLSGGYPAQIRGSSVLSRRGRSGGLRVDP